jgi:hypothetical protein
MTKTILSSLVLALALTGCGDKKKDDAASKTTDTAGKAGASAAPAKKSGALTEIQTAVDAAKTKDDIDAIFDKCMGAAIDLGLNGVAEPDKDPAYRAACKVGLAKKRAAIVVADSTPDKMNVMCLSASMQLEELGEEGGPEAAEMKKLLGDVNKACGLE